MHFSDLKSRNIVVLIEIIMLLIYQLFTMWINIFSPFIKLDFLLFIGCRSIYCYIIALPVFAKTRKKYSKYFSQSVSTVLFWHILVNLIKYYLVCWASCIIIHQVRGILFGGGEIKVLLGWWETPSTHFFILCCCRIHLSKQHIFCQYRNISLDSSWLVLHQIDSWMLTRRVAEQIAPNCWKF